MKDLQQLIETIRAAHLPFPPASMDALQAGRELGLPEDLLAFYSHCNGALLHSVGQDGGNFRGAGRWWKWSILPVEELRSFESEMKFFAEGTILELSKSWIKLVDVEDGNWLAIQCGAKGKGEILDCFHESLGTVGDHAIVALGFTEGLAGLLESDSPFWLSEDRPQYGAY